MQSGRLRQVENFMCRNVLKLLQLKALWATCDDPEHVNEWINSTAEWLTLTTKFSTSGCEIATSGGYDERMHGTALGIKGKFFAIWWNSPGTSGGTAPKSKFLCN